MSGIYACVDVGTGGCRTAVCDADGHVELVRNERGDCYTPSCLLVDDGKVHIGEKARSMRPKRPERFISHYKHMLGTGKSLLADGEPHFPAEDCVKAYINAVKVWIPRDFGCELTELLVLYPANFPNEAIQGLKKAIEECGIRVARMLKEPAAAAYRASAKTRFRPNRTRCATDVGEGTTDICLFKENGPESITVLANGGIFKLGGRNFTDALFEIVLRKVSDILGSTLTRSDLSATDEIDWERHVVMAKVGLSFDKVVDVPLFYEGRPVPVEITREEYESQIDPLVDDILVCIEDQLKSVQLDPSSIDDVIAIGGPSNTPYITSRLEEFFGRPPIVERPQYAAVEGGALYFASLNNNEVLPQIRDVLVRDLGVCVRKEDELMFSCILSKGTPIPCSSAKDYGLEFADQEKVLVEVLEGERGSKRDESYHLFSVDLSDLPQGTTSVPGRIRVRIDVDASGLITVTVTDNLGGGEESGSGTRPKEK